MEGCGASMSFVNYGSVTVILRGIKELSVFLQFPGLIWMAFGIGDLHIILLNT